MKERRWGVVCAARLTTGAAFLAVRGRLKSTASIFMVHRCLIFGACPARQLGQVETDAMNCQWALWVLGHTEVNGAWGIEEV